MSTGIATHVKSLGDFPLNPNHGKAWLWSGDGARLLWMSPQAKAALGIDIEAQEYPQLGHGGALNSFALELANVQPDRQPLRAVQLPLGLGKTPEVFICLSRHVPLADGSGYGLLTVSIDAAPRLSRDEAAPPKVVAQGLPEVAPAPAMSETAIDAAEGAGSEQAGPSEAIDPAEQADLPAPSQFLPKGPIDLRPSAIEAPKPDAIRKVPEPVTGVPPARPAWTDTAAELRRPLRFVWQTDANGRFAHVSRELADAVGAANARILGKHFSDVVGELGLKDATDAAAMFGGTATWTALPVIWPVAGTDLAAPIEMSGMPVLEHGIFSGFRGYGIIRIDRATPSVPLSVPKSAPAVEEPDGSASPSSNTTLPSRTDVGIGSEPQAPEPPPAQQSQLLNDNARTADPDSVTLPDAEEKLTPSERNAFREIAKALGAAGLPPAETLDQPPALPHQMPEWIARRQGSRRPEPPAPAAPQPPPPAPADAAIVPFGAFQTRLDKRSRESATGQVAALLDKLPLPVLIMQRGQPVHANASFLELAGYADLTAFRALGGPDSFFTAPPPEGGERDARSIVVRRKDGVSLAVDAQVIATTWDDQPATLTSFRPLVARPDRSEADLAAARSELAELRFVLDTAVDGVLSLDAMGRILAVNRSAEALFGFDQKEIIGEPLTVLLEPESHATALDYLQGLKADGVATIMNDGRDVMGRERHGGRIPLFMTLGRLAGDHDRARYCAVLRDVTIWKKSEAELTQARRLAEDANANKSDFLARISHEIRTPMNAIIGFADVMRSETFGPLGNERYKGYANDIHTSGVHVVSLVNDLLDLSKIAAGKLELSFGSVDLNQAVSDSVSMIQPQANAGSVIVRSQLAQRMPPVVADQRSIRQIMINLLSNAAKFTEPGGQVVVTTAINENGEATIRVRDTGIGMNEDEVRKALEPFRQIPGPKSQGGTGLGLPLTKALAEANRAAFNITSEPGKGTLAEIVFPATRVLAE